MNEGIADRSLVAAIKTALAELALGSEQTFKTGFDSDLAPKDVLIKRGGTTGKDCLEMGGVALPYTNLVGHVTGMSVEEGHSQSYGDPKNKGYFQYVTLSLRTDQYPIIRLSLGTLPKPSVAFRSIILALSEATPAQLERYICLMFSPHPGSGDFEQKIVKVQVYCEGGTELNTSFPKEKNTGRSDDEIYQYWKDKLHRAYQNVMGGQVLKASGFHAHEKVQLTSHGFSMETSATPDNTMPVTQPTTPPAMPSGPGPEVEGPTKGSLFKQLRQAFQLSNEWVQKYLNNNWAAVLPNQMPDETFMACVDDLCARVIQHRCDTKKAEIPLTIPKVEHLHGVFTEGSLQLIGKAKKLSYRDYATEYLRLATDCLTQLQQLKAPAPEPVAVGVPSVEEMNSGTIAEDDSEF